MKIVIALLLIFLLGLFGLISYHDWEKEHSLVKETELLQAAHALEQKGEFAEAEQNYLAAMQPGPRPESKSLQPSALAVASAGEFYLHQKRYVEAESLLKQATEMDKQEAKYLDDLAMCYDLEAKHAQADELWLKAVKMQPELRLSLEQAVTDSKDKYAYPEEAIKQLARVITFRKAAGVDTKRLALDYTILDKLQKNSPKDQ